MRVSIGAELTRGTELEIDVRPGTTVRDILRYVDATSAAPWCGTVALSLDHAAGTYPLLDGARLTGCSAEPCAEPTGAHLAVIAGPDAGGLIVVDAPRTLGRDGSAGGLCDGAMSRVHAHVHRADETIVLRDAGSTNGLISPSSTVFGAAARAGQVRLGDGDVVRIGDTWLAARGAAVTSASEVIHAAQSENTGRRASLMVGAGVSAIILATITGRWYLALIALVYPAVTLAPGLLKRLLPPAASPISALPDPTRPGTIPGHLSVAVCGAADTRKSLARAEILARGRRPPAHRDGLDEPWLEWLPPAQPGDGPVVLVDDPPSWATRTLRASTTDIEITTDGRRELSSALLGITAARAESAARRIAASQHHSRLPREVRWADLDRDDGGPPRTRSLDAPLALAVTAHGPHVTWSIDLDVHGPHVLVAGTTGSGKSAVLEALILSLCERWGPDDVRLALFDFKGGAGLGRCARLPHVAGMVTDLDGRHALRALAALGAELTDRKMRLAAAGCASYRDWESKGGAPARLLVVVDEFQEIGAVYRDFLPELTRLAAQGRSLGMHLVLATQRPSGAVTPDIRANTSITIALRVASESESRDLVGTGAAAAIPSDAPGRAIIAWGESREEVQFALPIATPTPPIRIAGAMEPQQLRHLSAVVCARHQNVAAREPLWHEPLPARIELSTLDAPGQIPLGVADRASQRSRTVLTWDPIAGPLAVVGNPSEDRDRALVCAAAGARKIGLQPVWLPSDARLAARTVALSLGRSDVVLVVEDVAKALSTLAAVDRGAAAETLVAFAASGGRIALGLGAGSPHRIATHASLRIVLSGTSPHDDALWAVPRELQGIAHEPGLVRAHDARGWCEARLAEPPLEPGMSAVLAHALPTRVEREMLADEQAIGIGGDDARQFVLTPGASVTVVGPPGAERDHAVHVVGEVGAGSVQCADAPMLMPARARDGVIIATEPTPRIAEELCRGASAGLVEPVMTRGRVLWVEAGVGACVQLVSRAKAPGAQAAVN